MTPWLWFVAEWIPPAICCLISNDSVYLLSIGCNLLLLHLKLECDHAIVRNNSLWRAGLFGAAQTEILPSLGVKQYVGTLPEKPT